MLIAIVINCYLKIKKGVNKMPKKTSLFFSSANRLKSERTKDHKLKDEKPKFYTTIANKKSKRK